MCRSVELVLSLSNHLYAYFTTGSDQSESTCWPAVYLKLYVGGTLDSSTTVPGASTLSVTRIVMVMGGEHALSTRVSGERVSSQNSHSVRVQWVLLLSYSGVGCRVRVQGLGCRHRAGLREGNA